jgi:hypothetical protein
MLKQWSWDVMSLKVKVLVLGLLLIIGAISAVQAAHV